MRFRLFRFCTLLIIMIEISCHPIYDDGQENLKTIFEELMETIDKNKREEYLTIKLDTMCESVKIMDYQIDSIFHEIIINRPKVNDYLDSILSTTNSKVKIIFLNVAFHAFLNDQDFTSSMVDLQYKRAVECYKDELEKIELAYSIENNKIAKTNFNGFQKGDTLSLILPFDIKNGRGSTFFFLGYPYSNKYEYADDSLGLKVILIDKYSGKKGNMLTDSGCMAFNVQIVELSDTNVDIMNQKLSEGDAFDFCLTDYGRMINKSE